VVLEVIEKNIKWIISVPIPSGEIVKGRVAFKRIKAVVKELELTALFNEREQYA